MTGSTISARDGIAAVARHALLLSGQPSPTWDFGLGRRSCYQPLRTMPRLVRALKASRLQPPQPGIGVRGWP